MKTAPHFLIAPTTPGRACGATCRFQTYSSAAITLPLRNGEKNNRSSVRDGVAQTLRINRDPWAKKIDPRRGNPTAQEALKGNNRVTAREIQTDESH